MQTKDITVIVVVVGALTWIGWTLYAALNKIPGDTISEFMKGLAMAAPFVALLLGGVVGHWFGLPFNDSPLVRYVRENPAVAFAIGYLGGALCWSMRG